MDYSKTLNLPETDFPMRGTSPKRNREFWNSGTRSMFIKRHWNAGKAAAIHSSRRPSLRQWRYSPGTRLEQNSQGHDLKISHHGRVSDPLYPRMGHPRPSHRTAAIKALGLNRKEASVTEFRDKCKEFSFKICGNTKGRIPAPRRARRLGRSLYHVKTRL